MADQAENALREQYNAICDEDAEPAEVDVPESFPVPQSFEDYELLSGLVMAAWLHAHWIGYWYHKRDKDSQGLLPSPFAISDMAEHLIGLHVILKSLRAARDDFKIFDIAATETPSVHIQLLAQALAQYRSLAPVYTSFTPMDYDRMCKLLPANFARRCGDNKASTWCSPDWMAQELRVQAELRKVEDRLFQNPLTARGKLQSVAKKKTTKRGRPRKADPDAERILRAWNDWTFSVDGQRTYLRCAEKLHLAKAGRVQPGARVKRVIDSHRKQKHSKKSAGIASEK